MSVTRPARAPGIPGAEPVAAAAVRSIVARIDAPGAAARSAEQRSPGVEQTPAAEG